MKYEKSAKYNTDLINQKIMGPNPLKLEEELMKDNKIKKGSVVMDLGSGQGITSIFLAKEYGFKVYATDLWSDAEENRKFFTEMGLTEEQIIPVKADATDLKYEKELAEKWTENISNKKVEVKDKDGSTIRGTKVVKKNGLLRFKFQ